MLPEKTISLIDDDEWPIVQFPPVAELPVEDGVPLESPWHRAEINLLIDSIDNHWRNRSDYYVGGNMFVYFSLEQIRHRDYRGPDFFAVLDVDGAKPRNSWVVWDEGGRYPDLIIELLSPSTADFDKTGKKQLYERTFRTPEYFCYDPLDGTLLGWRLQNGHDYTAILPDADGRLWSQVLKMWLGNWGGKYLGQPTVWLRFFTEDNQLVNTTAESEAARAEQEAARAEQEAARATAEMAARLAAEAEVAQLRQELARLRSQGVGG